MTTGVEGLDQSPGDAERRLNRWLHDDAGIAEPRRIVSRSTDRILVSKFPPGFGERLRQTLAGVPDLFGAAAVTAAYRREALEDLSRPKVEVWRRAMGRVLVAGRPVRLSPAQRSEVQAGIDSVAAMLAGILWSDPPAGAAYQPLAGEIQAFRDAVGRLRSDSSPFTRRYGVFESAEVVNHCPGAPFARRLLDLGWLVCTGTPPPVSAVLPTSR